MTTETSIYEYAKQGLELSADKTAIWYYGKSITYRELFYKIDNVADNLYQLGVREGTVVTIHLPNCPQAVMAIYAVAKLGGICNMVHALMPKEGLRDNMDFAESNILITYVESCINIANITLYVDISYHMQLSYRIGVKLKSGINKIYNVICFESYEKKASKYGVFPTQSSLAQKVVIYFNSSGTTGESKTVMHSNATINRCVDNAVDYYKLVSRTNEVVISALPLFHGMGFAHVIHISLSGGAKLIQVVSWNAKQVAKLVDSFKATLIVGVPKMFKSLLDIKTFHGNSLHHCFIAGDKVRSNLKTDFNNRVGKIHCLYEAYGMTETVVGVCSCSADHDNIQSCGYPVSNSEIMVLNNNEPQAIGTGELIVHINTLMLGYLKDPESSNKVFIDWNRKKWLKTGDIGKIDDDGFIYFIDRLKNVIVHNGYNIYPLAIERISMSVEGVEDICIIGKFDGDTDHIYAYVIKNENVDSNIIENDLYVLWNKQIPKYAIPERIRFISSFPRNYMGKIIREELKKYE